MIVEEKPEHGGTEKQTQSQYRKRWKVIMFHTGKVFIVSTTMTSDGEVASALGKPPHTCCSTCSELLL